MPTIRKVTAEQAGEKAQRPAPNRTTEREQQIATIARTQTGIPKSLIDQALAGLRAVGYQIHPHGLHFSVRYADAAPDVAPTVTVMDTSALLSLAGGFDAALAAQIAERAAQAAVPKAPLPPLPEDLDGWAWELTERGLRLVYPTEGYVTGWHPADLESSCIVEARRIQQRDAALAAEERVGDPFAAPAAAAARDRFATLGLALTYQAGHGWHAGDIGPMGWPEVEKALKRAERERERTRSAQATPIEPPPPPAQGAAAPAPTFPTAATLYVALDRLKPNPWQPRLSIDATYIAELAADIQARHDSRPDTRGLLQLPAGRIVDKRGKPFAMTITEGGNLSEALRVYNVYLQLAYGHNRLAAFQELAKTDPRYAALPIVVVTFSDEEMATAAWGENAQRRDLTVYEQAKAIEKYIADFGWTQEQAAALLKLDRSTVANKLRLLRLPKAAQQQLKAGKLSERQALALLPLTELPEALIKKAEGYSWAAPSKVLNGAAGMSSDEIRRKVDEVVRLGSEELTPAALAEHTFADLAGVHAARCLDCPLRIGRAGGWRCSDPACLKIKQGRWRDLRMAAAMQATGLVDAGDVPYDQREGFGQDPKLGERIIKAGCAQLRLYQGGYSPIHPQGFEEIGIVCVHEQGKHCACLMKLRRQQTKEDPAAQRLKAAKKEIAEQIVGPAITAVAAAIAAGNVGAWRAMLQSLDYRTRQQGAEADLAGVQQLIAAYLVKQSLGWQGDEQPKLARANVGKLLESAGLPRPWEAAQPAPDVCAQTPVAAGDPLATIRERLAILSIQIDGAVGSESDLIATYRARLADLADELETLSDEPAIDDGVYEALARQISAVEQGLQNLAEAAGASLASEVAS